MSDRQDSDRYPTPYDDSYPTCERTCAELRVYTGEMDPDWVTQRLRVSPTRICKKGERKVNSLGRERVVKLNGWSLSSEGRSSSLDLRRHLDWLLDKLEPGASQLRELQYVPGVTMYVTCTWWSAHAQGGPTLWPEHLRRLADLNLECQFDISFYGEED
jgi:hypothetical protein